jgi:hypothetical protein
MSSGSRRGGIHLSYTSDLLSGQGLENPEPMWSSPWPRAKAEGLPADATLWTDFLFSLLLFIGNQEDERGFLHCWLPVQLGVGQETH